VVLEYTYNARRQLETEKATTIPASVYGGNSESDAVRMIIRTYDELGRPLHVVSFNSPEFVTLLNHVYLTYGTHGRVAQSDQDHTDAIGTGTAHQTVTYAYDDSATSDVYDDGLRLVTTKRLNGQWIDAHLYSRAFTLSLSR
jgi:hypothetical protein